MYKIESVKKGEDEKWVAPGMCVTLPFPVLFSRSSNHWSQFLGYHQNNFYAHTVILYIGFKQMCTYRWFAALVVFFTPLYPLDIFPLLVHFALFLMVM